MPARRLRRREESGDSWFSAMGWVFLFLWSGPVVMAKAVLALCDGSGQTCSLSEVI